MINVGEKIVMVVNDLVLFWLKKNNWLIYWNNNLYNFWRLNWIEKCTKTLSLKSIFNNVDMDYLIEMTLFYWLNIWEY